MKNILLLVNIFLNVYDAYAQRWCGIDSCELAPRQSSGLYLISLPYKKSIKPFWVDCDQTLEGGGWMIILRRTDGSVDFDRSWNEYKDGFGNIYNEYFIGLEKLHVMTTQKRYELLVVMVDNMEKEAKEHYDHFEIDSENNQYMLKSLGKSTGTAGDSLRYHEGSKFSTKDRQNHPQRYNEGSNNKKMSCPHEFYGGWWYNDCYRSHLTGLYNSNGANGTGIQWDSFNGYYDSMKNAIMMIRAKK